MPESWADYGYPDDLAFRTAYLPAAGMMKAINERWHAVGWTPWGTMTVPEYFSRVYPGPVYLLANMEDALKSVCGQFVNPDKIIPGNRWETYVWTYSDLMQAIVNDPNDLIAFYPDQRYATFTPDWPVKWAVQRYKAVNMLRYVPTVRLDYPYFEYEDLNDTFNFKEVSA